LADIFSNKHKQLIGMKSRILLEQEIKQQLESLGSVGFGSYDQNQDKLGHQQSEEVTSHTESVEARTS